jgi:hypothetical protein
MRVHKRVFLLYSAIKRTENRSVTMFIDIKAACGGEKSTLGIDIMPVWTQ